MSVGSAILSRANVKLQKIATRRAKLSCLLDAFTIAVSRYFINTSNVTMVTQIPAAVTKARKTPAPSFNWRFFTGKRTHFVLASLDFCFSGHCVQLVDPGSSLTVPPGHLMHFQQHEVVTSLRVPGEHLRLQTETGTSKYGDLRAHLILEAFNCKFRFSWLFHVPTITLPWNPLPICTFKIWKDECWGSPFSLNSTIPVFPWKLTFLKYDKRSLPFTDGSVWGHAPPGSRPFLSTHWYILSSEWATTNKASVRYTR